MLITLFGVVALFLIAQRLTLRYSAKPILSNVVAAALVFAFFAGFGARGLLFPDQQVSATAPVAPVPNSAPKTTTPQAPAPEVTLPGVAVSPLKRALNPAELRALVPAGKPVPYALMALTGTNGANQDLFPAGSKVSISGWAGDPATKSTAAGLIAIVDGGNSRFDITRGYGADRPDVARAFQTMRMLHTGFSATLSTAGLSKGQHILELGVIRADGRHYQIITAPPKVFTLN